MQEVWIRPHGQIVYAQSSICPGKWDAQDSLGFWDTNGSPNPGQIIRPSDSHKKREPAVPADYRVKLKESEKKDEYQDLARKLKRVWNMKVVIGALGSVTKELLQGLEDLEIRGCVEIIKTTPLLRSARILRRVLETWGDLLSFRLQ